MNDFTKKELIEIYWKFEYYFDDLDGLAKQSPVMLKIQSMIDNYCEHEFDEAIYDREETHIGHKCNKCNAVRWLNDE